jgi:DNA-directed RNA polymerase subunit L
MRQIKRSKATKTKLTILIAIISMTTGCATSSRHKRLALKIVKNNNVILKQIKHERSNEKIKPLIKESPELFDAEKRLLTAINAVIESNESLKKEFKTQIKKETEHERK